MSASTQHGRPEHPERPVQSVTETQVYGHLVQISEVEGNVTVRLGQAVFESEQGVEQIVEGEIPQQPRGFQLREDMLQRLDDQVAVSGAAVICALTGTPGVGKTLLAASYAWSCQAAGWPVVAWIAAETGDQIVSGLAALAGRLGVRGDREDAATAARRARDALAASQRPGLLVFDNAADLEQMRIWCPATGATRVIITSRSRAFERLYEPVPVSEFTPAEAVAFLRERTGLADAVGAMELAEELGYLPLALAQAAALVSKRRHMGYLGHLRQIQALSLERYLISQPGDAYPVGTVQTILLAAAQAEAVHPDAEALLETLAVLSPGGLPRIVLYGTSGIEADFDNREERVRRDAIDQLLDELADSSLISFTGHDDTVLMHRLVQRVIRERALHQDRLQAALTSATTLLHHFNTALPTGSSIWTARSQVERLVEQTNAIHAVARAVDALTEDLLVLRANCGIHLSELADLTRAIVLLEETLAEAERVLGDNHPITLYAGSALAGKYWLARRLEEAINLGEGMLQRYERVLGSDHPDTLACRHNLAHAYRSAGRADDAIAVLDVTLREAGRALSGDHPNMLQYRRNLALAYRRAGRLDEAISLFEAILPIYERVLGDEHPDTLGCHSNLAGAYRSAGRLGEAINLLEATLPKRERVLGVDHIDTLTNRHDLAATYALEGRRREAIALYEATLSECGRVLGGEHPLTRVVQSYLNELRDGPVTQEPWRPWQESFEWDI